MEDGYYKIPVKLWHAYEEKESMGNKAMVQVAEIEVKDKAGYLYIGSGKMEYMSITASLVNIYFQKDDGNYYPAEAGDYEMEIPKEKDKRPAVFRTKLVNMDEMTKVFVDPKVEPMGDEPIRARIKLDYDSIEKIDKDQAELIKNFETGPKKPEFDSSSSGEVENKNLIVNYEPGTFDEEFSFYGNKLSGKNAEEYSKDFDKLDQVNVFKIEFLGPLDEIKEEDKKIQDKRKKIIPKKEMELRLPLLKFTKEDNLALYDFTSVEKKKLEFTFDKDHVKAKVKNPGVYVLVKSGDALVPNANTESSENKLPTEKKNEKAEKFLKTVKKTSPKPILNKTNKVPVNTENTNNIKPLNPQPNAPSSLQKQMDLANKENKTKNLNKEADTIQEREYSGLIIFILMVFLTFNILSIFFIRKNLDAIRDMREEILFIGGLRKDEK
ncbi:NEAT domain-containing protein [Peptoniphilus duerdenii]|uniref:NEAT domain-containing protein n=1 Tax=Peptoniphilus duerdenii TaxID=507750 RepID=UPI00288A8207|nr:NEAT domain-containing protein [Peptoniphilus duerdenii]